MKFFADRGCLRLCVSLDAGASHHTQLTLITLCVSLDLGLYYHRCISISIVSATVRAFFSTRTFPGRTT